MKYARGVGRIDIIVFYSKINNNGTVTVKLKFVFKKFCDGSKSYVIKLFPELSCTEYKAL